MTTTLAGQPGIQNPVDIGERRKALDIAHSVLVQAPAGYGKTTLLTERFLGLLSQVDDPRQIVAITFTTAAAAEMRHRILDALAKAAKGEAGVSPLAEAALQHAQAKKWDLLNQPAMLRISTVDSFCRELALQQPLLSGLGGGLSVSDLPEELYLAAARRALAELDNGSAEVQQAIADLLRWRDCAWYGIETLLVGMLAKRDRWMQWFVFDSNSDESVLRASLERPFLRAAADALNAISPLLTPQYWTELQNLGRFASANLNGGRFSGLANCGFFPGGQFHPNDAATIAEALAAYLDIAEMFTTKTGQPRATVTKSEGFPADHKDEKKRFSVMADALNQANFIGPLARVAALPPLHFEDADWRIIRASFILLRQAVGHLKSVFAEVGKVDFTEISQIALQAIFAEEGAAGEGVFGISEEIHHLLVDEFQDTSRRQHLLLAGLISHWQEQTGRTCFVVGDPLQSIYFFRDADAELFPRVQNCGLEMPDGSSLPFMPAKLTANFRTVPALVDELNDFFAKVFAHDDGSSIAYTPAVPARTCAAGAGGASFCNLHLEFVQSAAPFKPRTAEMAEASERAAGEQTAQIVELIRAKQPEIDEASKAHKKYRVAILARAHKALIPLAAALRKAEIPFRALDLEPLANRPEVQDALGLTRALLNAEDRVAWLGILRGPWCGLTLEEIHILTSADDPGLLFQPVHKLAEVRLALLSVESQKSVRRVLDSVAAASYLRATQPSQALGAWVESVWLLLGGDACVDAQARANLDLLWSVLDSLPSGDQDLLGPALDSALGKLTAQPDPNASSNCGVQLMTIHKAKGLEFEVVIIPELQASTAGHNSEMLSWVERGLGEPDESGDLTEFLIAPFQTKGAKGGATKVWVDRVYRDRERQEMRRLLYVAATRATDELHLFARPEYRVKEDDGSRTLATPTDSLLGTAWPAVEAEVQAQFALDQASPVAPAATTAPAGEPPTILHRLPETCWQSGARTRRP
jgi:ATP-dependent exoDNAse (exonuclease V) beta subunit